MNSQDNVAWFEAVIDARSALGDEFKPIGTLPRLSPRKDIIDTNTGLVLKKYIPKEPSEKLKAAMSHPSFEPDDKIPLFMGLDVNSPESSTVLFRFHVPPGGCEELGEKFQDEGVTVKVQLFAQDLEYMEKVLKVTIVKGEETEQNEEHKQEVTKQKETRQKENKQKEINKTYLASPIIVDDQNIAKYLGYNVPMILRKNPKYDCLKPRIRVIDFNVSGGGPQTSSHVFHSYSFKDQYQRGLITFRALFGRSEDVKFSVFVLDNDWTPVLDRLENVMGRMADERKSGNIYRHFYTQKLQNTNDDHRIDTGGALKLIGDRPIINTRPPSTYPTVFEMTTRLGVGVKQVLEDRREKILSLNTETATIRLLEIMGAGDVVYLGAIGTSTKFRFNSGDRLKVNFRLDEPIEDENWKFIVVDSFPWALQGKTMGVLFRPRCPPQPDNKNKAFRPHQATTLPVQRALADELDYARVILETATPIQVVVTMHDSEKSETRIIEAMNICSQRARNRYDQLSNRPQLATYESIRKWAEFMLMKDARVQGHASIVSDKAFEMYFKDLVDPDQKKCIAYLRAVPTTFNDLALGVLAGVPGSGKSDLAARVIVAKFIENPAARVVVLTAANQPADVLIRKINAALVKAKQIPRLSETLKSCMACRAYGDASETSYVVTLATTDLPDDVGDVGFAEVVTDIAEAYKPKGLGTKNASKAIIEGCLARGSSICPTADLLPDWEFLRPSRARTFSTGGVLDVARWDIQRTVAKQLMGMVKDSLPISINPEPHQTLADVKRMWTGVDDEPFNSQPNGPDDGYDGKMPRMSKAKRNRLVLEESRRTYREYTADNATKAVQVSKEDMEGTEPLNFYGPLLEGGVIDIHHHSIPADLHKQSTAIETVKRLNLQLEPTATGVDDKRFKVIESSLAQMVAAALQMSAKWGATAVLLDNFIIDKDNMAPEDRKKLKNDLRVLVNEAKGQANILGLTDNALAFPRNRDNMGDFYLAIIDEGGMMNVAEFLTISANLTNCTQYLIFGDCNQLEPQVQSLAGPPGFTKELTQSVMRYLESNHWPSALLYMNRRGAPNINDIPSVLFYRGRIIDAPCTKGSHQWTSAYASFFKTLFPRYTGNIPNIYLDVHGAEEIHDEVTGSYINLATAAVIVSIVEMGIRQSIFNAADVPHITHYKAQMKVFSNAYASLALEYPGVGFEDIVVASTDSIQGDQGSCPFITTVRTTGVGFTNNLGRCVVALTRAQDFQVVVDNVSKLGLNSASNSRPYMRRAFDEARKRKVCIKITADGEHAHLMTHRYVFA